MGKYKGFKNRLEMFFSSEEGQRILNFAYSFGAAIVILGALFKLLYLPYADIMLGVGMGTEAIIFALSAFDKPTTNYKWEEVFPVLTTENPADRPDFSKSTGISPQATGLHSQHQSQPQYVAAAAPGANIQFGTHIPEIGVATERYVNEISEVTLQLERLKEITGSLTHVQSILLNSFGAITANSDMLSSSSTNYVQQMEALNRNVSGLNTIYEIQLKSVSSQLDTIDKVNSGLANIRSMYENSTMDSFKIRQETERMTENLAQLNKVYERMLNAMTASMNPLSGR